MGLTAWFDGRKTVIVMGIALACGLWQHFIGPIPSADPELFNIAVPMLGLLLRFVTGKPISLRDVIGAGRAALEAREAYNDSAAGKARRKARP